MQGIINLVLGGFYLHCSICRGHQGGLCAAEMAQGQPGSEKWVSQRLFGCRTRSWLGPQELHHQVRSHRVQASQGQVQRRSLVQPATKQALQGNKQLLSAKCCTSPGRGRVSWSPMLSINNAVLET